MDAPAVLLQGSDRLGTAIEQRLVLAGCPVKKLGLASGDSLQREAAALGGLSESRYK